MTEKFFIFARDLYGQLGVQLDVPGVYQLKCIDGQGYRSIPRMLMADPDGVLYIGSSKNIRSGIIRLRKALCAAAKVDGYTNAACHPCGQKYSKNVREKFPFEMLCVTVHPVSQDRDAEGLAIFELQTYVKAFGEVPPFNDEYPKETWQSNIF